MPVCYKMICLCSLCYNKRQPFRFWCTLQQAGQVVFIHSQLSNKLSKNCIQQVNKSRRLFAIKRYVSVRSLCYKSPLTIANVELVGSSGNCDAVANNRSQFPTWVAPICFVVAQLAPAGKAKSALVTIVSNYSLVSVRIRVYIPQPPHCTSIIPLFSEIL